VNKNWPNDAKVNCKVFSSLVELIKFEIPLLKQLNEFESSFEQDELKQD
jgi:hypothetical protein